MARAAYEYLIQYVSDLRGITQARGELRKLNVYNKKFGRNVGQVTQVLSKNITQSTRQIQGGAVQTTRNIQRTFKTASGQIYTYSRVVTTSGGKVLKTTGRLQKGFGAVGKSMQGMSRAMGMIATRALKTIPVWLVLRAVFMGVTSAITNTIRTWVDLSNEMGRVAGVTRGTEADVNNLKDAIIDFSRTSTRGFKEVASVVYALGSAGLTVTEQMAGFKHIMDVTIGTFGNAEQIAKLTAGAYNVFGKSIEGAYTISARFKALSDILAYTYSTQQVELSEIATAMTYVASIGSLLDISFEQLVGTIGFLNTGMLKGSKSGTALMNAFVKLAVSGDKLAKLGVVFDPSRPLNLLSIMEQLHNIYGEQALSLVSLREIMDVFGRRGGRAAAQMIDSYDRWRKTLDNTHRSFSDFAKEMREKAEDTLPGAFRKLGNAIKSNLIDKLKQSEPWIKRVLGLATEHAERAALYEKYWKVLPKSAGLVATQFNAITGPYHIITKAGKELVDQNKLWYDTLLKVEEETKKVKESTDKVVTFEVELNNLAKKRAENLITEEELMRELKKLTIDRLKGEGYSHKKMVQIVKELRELIKIEEKEIKNAVKIGDARKKEIENIKLAGKYRLMETIGIEEGVIQITKMKDLMDDINEKIILNNEQRRKEIEAGKETNFIELQRLNIQDLLLGRYKNLEQAALHISKVEKLANNIRKFRIGIEEQILAKKQEQLNTVTNLVVQYGKADKFEKGRIRRALELMGKTPEEVAHAFRTRAFDERIILDFWNIFDKETQETVTKAAMRLYGLSGAVSNLGDIFSKQFELPKEDIINFWNNWKRQGLIVANEWGEHFATLITAAGEIVIGREEELLEKARQMPKLPPGGITTTGAWKPATPTPYIRGERFYYEKIKGGIIAADDFENFVRRLEENGEKTREEIQKMREEHNEYLNGIERATKGTNEKI